MQEKSAWENRTAIYLASSACAEFIADLFLCPLEAVRIRSVSDKAFPQSLPGGFARIAGTEGITGLYAGLVRRVSLAGRLGGAFPQLTPHTQGPILLKQIPYTMAKFAVQGWAAEKIYAAAGSSPETMSKAGNVSVSLGSGVIAGVAAAIISHPADTLLSKVNKAGAGGTGSIMSRLMNIAGEIGFFKLATTGLGPRCIMIGTLTAGQFGIFDTVMLALGASKFHFHQPAGEKH